MFSRSFLGNRILGGVLTSSVVLAGSWPGGDSTLAQMSLPLDVDLSATESESVPPEASPQPPLPLSPLTDRGSETPGSAPLEPPEETLPDLTEPPPETAPSEATPVEPPEATPAEPTAGDLERFLVGQDVNTAISMLEQDGWVVVAQTPGEVQLDRGPVGLNLQVDDLTGEVIEVDLLNLY